MKIRGATSVDIPVIAGLLEQLFALEQDFMANPVKQIQGLTALLNCESAYLWVVEVKGKVVGFCSMQRLISTSEGGPVGLIEDVIIDQAYQGQGLGKVLLQQVKTTALSLGLKRIQLLADCQNQPALTFYQGQGWHSTNLIALKKSL